LDNYFQKEGTFGKRSNKVYFDELKGQMVGYLVDQIVENLGNCYGEVKSYLEKFVM